MSYNSSIDWSSMSDRAIVEQIGKFVRHHRLAQNKSQGLVAKDANISRSTLSLLERGEKVNLISLIHVLRVLDLLHIMESFRVIEEISPLLYAREQLGKRYRASKRKENTNDTEEDIGW